MLDYTHSNKGQFFLIFLGLIVVIAAVLAINYLPAYWITLAIAIGVIVIVLAKPMTGIVLVLTMLYFPLFPNISFGGIEFSITTLPILALGFSALMKILQNPSKPHFEKWQVMLLVALSVSILLTSLFSFSYTETIRRLPNLGLYLVILFALVVLVDTPQKLVTIAKIILVLTFMRSIWRLELRPLRLLFGLPSLGINGAVFSFHPAIALSLVIFFIPTNLFSKRWRLFAGITLFSCILHGILYQTRAGWLALLVTLSAFLIGLERRRWLLLTVLFLGILFIGFQNVDLIANNVLTTQGTITGLFSDDRDQIYKSDLIRIELQEAAWSMFLERPVLGWGPNVFMLLKPQYVLNPSQLEFGGAAFNSWLIMFVESGIVGGITSLMVFLAPLVITIRQLCKYRDDLHYLTLAFTLAAVGLTVHLFFIDLLYSFSWFYAGLALAAARISLTNIQNVGETKIIETCKYLPSKICPH